MTAGADCGMNDTWRVTNARDDEEYAR